MAALQERRLAWCGKVAWLRGRASAATQAREVTGWSKAKPVLSIPRQCLGAYQRPSPSALRHQLMCLLALSAAAPSPTGPRAALVAGMQRVKWNRGVLLLWASVLLGLVGTSAGLWPQRLDLLHSRTELSHLAVGEPPGSRGQFVIAPINLTTTPYTWVPKMPFS